MLLIEMPFRDQNGEDLPSPPHTHTTHPLPILAKLLHFVVWEFFYPTLCYDFLHIVTFLIGTVGQGLKRHGKIQFLTTLSCQRWSNRKTDVLWVQYHEIEKAVLGWPGRDTQNSIHFCCIKAEDI